ncbi:hypothetical protein [Alteromonas sp.]|nr:hypothetical protein [Alteromonas sp.]
METDSSKLALNTIEFCEDRELMTVKVDNIDSHVSVAYTSFEMN